MNRCSRCHGFYKKPTGNARRIAHFQHRLRQAIIMSKLDRNAECIGEKLNVLLISHRFPWPWTRGDTLTVAKMAQYFGSRHNLDLLCGQPADPEGAEWLKPYVRDLVCTKFSVIAAMARTCAAVTETRPFQLAWCSSRALKRAAHSLNSKRKYDVVIAYYIRTAEAATQLVGPKKVVAMQLSLALQWQRAAQHTKGLFSRMLKQLEADRLTRYESEMFTQFDRCLLISKHDLTGIPGAREDRVIYNPHGVDIAQYCPNPAVAKEPGLIIFSGNMAFHPNEDAVRYFVEEIFPQILKAVPEARFMIVGKSPGSKVQSLAKHPRVEVTGTVPRIEDYLDRAEIGVDPLRIGGGLQNKVLEGMSMGIPMVVSRIANEGIGAQHGTGLFVADHPAAFAEHTIRLLRDGALRSTMSAAAREFIVREWTWDHHFQRLEMALLELSSTNGQTPAQAH